tara:strand:+ start:8409 stop:9188 length:780 start_codon:yes stop_codon:yes gene_type:complete
MEHKPWPDWIKTGFCDFDGMPVERDIEILQEFIKHNYIGNLIRVNKNDVSAPNTDLPVRRIDGRGPIRYDNYKSIPDDTFRAKITGIYCARGGWRLEAKLIDLEHVVYSKNKSPITGKYEAGEPIKITIPPRTVHTIKNLSPRPHGATRNSDAAATDAADAADAAAAAAESEANRRRRDATTRRSAETAHNYTMLNRGEMNVGLFEPGLGRPGWTSEFGSAWRHGGGKRMRKSKRKKSKKRKRSSRNYKSKRKYTKRRR